MIIPLIEVIHLCTLYKKHLVTYKAVKKTLLLTLFWVNKYRFSIIALFVTSLHKHQQSWSTRIWE